MADAPPISFSGLSKGALRLFLLLARATECAWSASFCSRVGATGSGNSAGGPALGSRLTRGVLVAVWVNTCSFLTVGLDGSRLWVGAVRLVGELEVHCAHTNLVPHLAFFDEHLR